MNARRRDARPRRPLVVGLIASLAMLAAPGAAPAQGPPGRLGPPRPPVSTLEAVGEAVVAEAPDLAIATVGVTTQARTPKEAMDQNAATAQAVIKALRDLGLTAPDALRTRTVSLNPIPEVHPGQAPRIIAYQASNQVEVRLTQIAMLGAVLDAALAAGATDIGALRFARADARPAQLRALQDAVKDARARVDAMAQALGVRITRISEVRALDGGARPMMEAAVMYRSAASVPVEPGLQSVAARVLLRAEFQ